MSANYRKGRRNEYRTMRLLEAAGYICIRAAGSHSPFDVTGVSLADVVLVQCKTNEWPSVAEMETISNVRVPPNVRKLVHRWNDRSTLPLVKEV